MSECYLALLPAVSVFQQNYLFNDSNARAGIRYDLTCSFVPSSSIQNNEVCQSKRMTPQCSMSNTGPRGGGQGGASAGCEPRTI